MENGVDLVNVIARCESQLAHKGEDANVVFMVGWRGKPVASVNLWRSGLEGSVIATDRSCLMVVWKASELLDAARCEMKRRQDKAR